MMTLTREEKVRFHDLNRKAKYAAIRSGDAKRLSVLFDAERQVCDGAATHCSDMMEIAAQLGHLECVKVMVDECVGISSEVAEAAARGGHLDCLVFLRKYHFWNGQRVLEAAMEGGSAECIQIAITQVSMTNKRKEEQLFEEGRMGHDYGVIVGAATVISLVVGYSVYASPVLGVLATCVVLVGTELVDPQFIDRKITIRAVSNK